MADKKTRVILEAETKGFDKARRDVKGVNDALGVKDSAKDFKRLEQQVGGLFRQLRGLTEGFKQFNAQLSSTKKEQTAFRDMASGIKEALTAMRDMTAARDKDRVAQERQAKQHSFRTGLIQGSGVADYVPENLRMARYAAGQAVGRTARGAAGAAWGSTVGGAFSGVGAMGQGLAGIPIVGGMAAGQLQALQSAAQEALGYESARYEAKQFKSFGGDRASGYRAETDAEMKARQKPVYDYRKANPETAAGQSLLEEKYLRTKGIAEKAGFGDTSSVPGGVAQFLGLADQPMPSASELAAEVTDRTSGAALRTKHKKGILSAEAQRRRSVLVGPRSGGEIMRDLGVRYGMAEPDALKFGGSVMSAGGITTNQLTERQFSTAAGAQGRLGIGGDVMGAFIRGGKGFGGDKSGKDSSQAMVDAINEGMQLGLEGSDLQSYMREMADSLMSFDRTGMPIDMSSVAGMAKGFAAMGVGGMTGQRMAQGIRETGTAIAGGGPQNASQMLVMRQLFGYKGGGTKDFFEAQVAASQGKVQKGGLDAMMGSLTKGKDKYANAMQVQQFFKQIGVQLGPEQAMALAGGDPGARASAEAQLSTAAGRSFTPEGLAEEGKASGGLRRQAGLSNTRAAAGARALPGMQSFEEAQAGMLKNAAHFSGIVKTLGDNAKDISALLGPGSKNLATILEALVSQVF